MNFDDYQQESRKTAIYPDKDKPNIQYPTLGLCGECGEVAEKVKKIVRDKGGIISLDDREGIRQELGDVLWYVAALCSELGLSLNDVAEFNILKLTGRQMRDRLKGNGDNR
jgi:NTP pyrophosphatase (non-canonical NTP hydrolase)